jgi:hypothetical protein
MAIPVSAVSTDQIFTNLQNQTINVKSYMTNVQSGLTSGALTPTTFLSALSAAISLLSYVNTVVGDQTTISSLVAYANLVIPNSPFTPTSLSNSISALSALTQAMIAEYPKSASGNFLQDRTFDVNGNISWSPFSAALFPNTNNAITAWLATIN